MPSTQNPDVTDHRTEAPIDAVLEALGDIVETPPEAIDPDTVLTALGIDSYTAVRLRRRLFEDTEVDLELTDFLGDATASSLAEHIARNIGHPRSETPTATPMADESDPHVDASPRDESFELSAVQQAYLVGREPAFPLGGVATYYYYYEFDRTSTERNTSDAREDLRVLEKAWNAVVRRHPMLRFTVTADARGVVQPSVSKYSFDVTDLTQASPEARSAAVEDLRRVHSHRVLPTETGPLYDIRAALLPGDVTRLFVGFDVLALDMAGWITLMREWGARVNGRSDFAPLGLAFPDIVRARRSDPQYQRRRAADVRYWTERAPEISPGPALPWLAEPHELGVPRFTRYATELSTRQWDLLQAAATARGLTPTAVLLASFAITLHCWGATEAYALNTTLFDRDHTEEEQPPAESIGDFTTTVLVQMPLVADSDFAAFSAAVNHQFWSDMDHRTVSGMEVLRLGNKRIPQSANIVHIPGPSHPVVFTSGLGLSERPDSPTEWLGTEVFGVSQTPQVLLDHIVRDDGGRLRIAWDTVDGALDPDLVRAMAQAHQRLLGRLAENDDTWTDRALAHDPTFRPPEPVADNAFTATGPLLTDPFDARAADASPAIISGAAEHSAERVRSATTDIATTLATRGIGPGDIVAVSAEKSPAQIIAVLGVAASGAAYVPVEPSWPAERVASVVRQAGIEHALLSAGTDTQQWPPHVDILVFDEGGTIGSDGSTSLEQTARRVRDAENLAYIIFTSGSTGEPKGVAIEHRAARTTLDDLMGRYPLTSGDRVLGLSAFSFDLSVFDIFSVIGAGGALVLPDSARLRDPGHWMDVMKKHHITLWNTAPALLEMLVEYAETEPERARRAFSSLRLVFLSGDYIPTTLPDRMRALAPEATLVSLGGATEAAIWSIFHPIERVDPEWTTIPYGRALGGQSFHVLDDAAACPVGQAGELFIGGGGLAREYIGNPEQTSSRFLTHPGTGKRLYRTGDLGRWRPDGSIEFLGRVDRQVKIAGHRIELGEIDSTLERLPEVRAAVAAAVPGPDDRPRLVCFVVDSVTADPLADNDLVTALAVHLPQYMIPSRFVRLPALPVTANGKVDHHALPNPFRREVVPAATPETTEPEATGTIGSLDVIADALARGLELRVTATAGSLSPRDSLDAAVRWADHAVRHLGDSVAVEEVHAPSGLLELHLKAAEVAVAATPKVRAATVDPVMEALVIDVFTELLDEKIGVSTPFFDVGATSLTLVLAHRRLSETVTAKEFTVIDLFANPTAEALARFLSDTPPAREHVGHASTVSSSSTNTSRPSTSNRREARLSARMHAAEITR